ncbi:CPCC family cysteine-rich protein [Ligilactobacillus salivarius]|uniref:CPCC family cysteine-rich protein n=1 Tax=Ligilactobacillus salivarius TaxID=1624 RepID=UPI003977D7B6
MKQNGKDNLIIINGSEFVHCPVCRTLTAVYDICDKCEWQNIGETNIDGGPNKMTLKEAREAYKKGLRIY